MASGPDSDLTIYQATMRCVEADINGEVHYPTDAYMVLAKLATDMNVTTDYLISQAHHVRNTSVTGTVI